MSLLSFGPLALEGDRCTVEVEVPEDVDYCEGHFEGNAILPGIAQLLPMVHDPVRAAWPDLGALTDVRRLKFKDAIRPGHRLLVTLSRSGERVRFEITRGETTCSTGSLSFGGT